MTLAERRKKLKSKQRNDVKNKDRGVSLGRMPLNTTKYPDIIFYDPKSGTKIKDGVYTCNIDIIPWIVQSDNYPSSSIHKDDLADKILYLVHRSVGPANDQIICPRTVGKKCYICEERQKLKDQGDEKEADKLIPSWRVVYNMIDLNDPDKGVQLFTTSRKNFDIALMSEIDIVEKKLGGEICSFEQHIEFRATVEVWDKIKFFTFSNFEFEEKEEELTEEDTRKAYPLEEMLIILPYNEIKSIFLNEDSPPETKATEERKKKEKAVLQETERTTSKSDKHPAQSYSLPQLKKYVKENKIDVKSIEKATKEELLEAIDQHENYYTPGEDKAKILSDTPLPELRKLARKQGIKITKEMTKEVILEAINMKEASDAVNKCSFEHIFGRDTDEFSECSQCSDWDACADAFDENKKGIDPL